MEKRLATQRVLGRDSKGREVLVAAPGQPIDEKRFEVDGDPSTTTSERKAAEAAQAEAERTTPPAPSEGEPKGEKPKAPRKGR